MCAVSVLTVGESLRDFAIRVDGAVVVAFQEVHVPRCKQLLLEIRAVGSGLPQLRQRVDETIFVVIRACDIGESREALRVCLAGRQT